MDVTIHSLHAAQFYTTYRGVPMHKNPFDYVMYQMILNEVKPDLVIEIGTFGGGSALYMADVMSPWAGLVHTIDIIDLAVPLVRDHPRIQRFLGGFEEYKLPTMVGTIMVIDDGSHMFEEVFAALHKFSPIVSSGSYFIVEDGIVTDLNMADSFHGGPQRATASFLNANSEFFNDTHWTNFFGVNATANPNGYLKKRRKVT